MIRGMLTEIAESALLGLAEPAPLRFTAHDERELPHVRGAIGRAVDGKLARLRHPVNRNAFLLGCLDYTEDEPLEHLLVGYGSRYGSTTKVDSVHHAVGTVGSVHLSPSIAHAMWEHYGQCADKELLIFHNHPYNPINFLFDNVPLVSRADRIFLEARTMNLLQLVRLLLNQGRVLFYLGENGFVKQFSIPSLVALLSRQGSADSERTTQWQGSQKSS